MKTIQAKLSMHHHTFFRSKLEVKWAQLFEGLGISSIYEPCGVVTSKGQYIPDFYLPALKTWIEVKPFKPSHIELLKFIEVCVKHKEFGFLVQGYPKSFPCGVEPHLANCNVDLVLPNGAHFQLSADEIYQLSITGCKGLEWVIGQIITESEKHYGGYLPPINEYVRVLDLKPANKKIVARRKRPHLNKGIKQACKVMELLYRRQQPKGAA